jgi:hypothetical protein
MAHCLHRTLHGQSQRPVGEVIEKLKKIAQRISIWLLHPVGTVPLETSIGTENQKIQRRHFALTTKKLNNFI